MDFHHSLFYYLSSLSLNVTAQISESLLYDGIYYRLFGEPLRSWLSERRNRHIRFQYTNTACSRAYIGKWEIVNERLYLVGIVAHFENGDKVTLAELFPESSDKLFADWFTGGVRCPIGKMISYVHSGFSRTYEKDLVLFFKEGVLVRQELIENNNSLNMRREPYVGNLGHVLDESSSQDGVETSQ